MDETNGDANTQNTNNGGWVKRLLLPAAAFALAIAITALLFIYGEDVSDLGGAGYLGSFLVSVVANGTIILPVPGLFFLFALGASLNPVLVGLSAGVGGAIGELTGYAAGFSGRRILSHNRAYIRAVGWVRKWGVWVLFLFTATPLPVDIVGIAAGALRFPIWKFLIICALGKTILYSGMAFGGRWGWNQMKGADAETIWTVIGASVAALVVVGLVLLVVRQSRRKS